MTTRREWPRTVLWDFNKEQIAWLQTCFDKMQAGEELRIDPFYERTKLLTPEIVDQVIKVIEDKYKYELYHSPGYHLKEYKIVDGYGEMHIEDLREMAEKSLRRPHFDELPHSQKLALVQGMDKVVVKYRAIMDEIGAEAPPPPLVEDADAEYMYY